MDSYFITKCLCAGHFLKRTNRWAEQQTRESMGNPRANVCLRKMAWHSALIVLSDQSISEINGEN